MTTEVDAKFQEIVDLTSPQNANPARMKAAQQAFLDCTGDKVSVLRRALNDPGRPSKSALFVVGRLSEAEQRDLFPEVLYWLCNSPLQDYEYLRGIIMNLPHDWVVENIDKHFSRALDLGEEWCYNLMFGICEDLDPVAAERLSRKALLSADPHIRKMGELWLEENGLQGEH